MSESLPGVGRAVRPRPTSGMASKPPARTAVTDRSTIVRFFIGEWPPRLDLIGIVLHHGYSIDHSIACGNRGRLPCRVTAAEIALGIVGSASCSRMEDA